MSHDGIEQEPLDYLHLVFGQQSSDDYSLKLSELKYEGQFMLEDIPAHYWAYLYMGSKGWATVEPFEDSYCLSLTTISSETLENV